MNRLFWSAPVPSRKKNREDRATVRRTDVERQLSGEQIGARRRELNKRSAVMNFQPAPFNGALQAGAVLRGRALVAKQEGAVEFLDVYPAILNWLEGMSVLEDATGGLFRVSKGAVGSQFQKLSLTFSSAS